MTAATSDNAADAGRAAGTDPEGAWPTPAISFDTAPDRYRHWRAGIDGE